MILNTLPNFRPPYRREHLKTKAMEYVVKNGLPVANKGSVIIDSVEHWVESGFVICNNSLNSKAWNVTDKKSECEFCKKYKNLIPKQLTLF